jgi:hypothetical protein
MKPKDDPVLEGSASIQFSKSVQPSSREWAASDDANTLYCWSTAGAKSKAATHANSFRASLSIMDITETVGTRAS